MKAKYLVALALSFVCCSSYAGSYQGKVRTVFAYSNKIFIHVNRGNFDNSITCTGREDAMTFWFDPATDYGKALLAISLIAKMSDKVVWTSGNGSCIDGPLGKSEQLTAIDLKG